MKVGRRGRCTNKQRKFFLADFVFSHCLFLLLTVMAHESKHGKEKKELLSGRWKIEHTNKFFLRSLAAAKRLKRAEGNL